ncbi:rRNA maturation RNase YbeY [Candidatus Microgenomates bacterium]|nr:rRNA maturation RNase YbeY [Candidatus Microgenomates bacterium]
MHKIFVYSQSHFPINRKKIKNIVNQTLNNQGITTNAEISVSFIGDRKMTELHEKYLNEEGTTDVLSFPLHEFSGENPTAPASRILENSNKNVNFHQGPDENILRLGDIVVSYPQAQRQAAEHNLLVDEEVNNLVEHGLLHLLGIHHDE